MKTAKFILPLVIVVSLLVVWQVIARESLAHDAGKTANYSIVVAEAVAPVASATVPGESLDEMILWPSNDLSDTVRVIESAFPISNDPYIEKQWALGKIGVVEAWRITRGNSETLVAVLDTGIDNNHQDLAGKIVAEANFVDGSEPIDIHGHGTHIAGIIAAKYDNGIGVTGLAPESRLLNAKVADDKGRCEASAVAEAIMWAVDNGANVINISVELREPSPELEDAINYAWDKGAVIIVAAGNDCSQVPVYPAYYDNAIAVAATRQDDTLAPLSNYGGWVDVAAPGFNIYSTMPGNAYDYKSGTSFATAYVSGLAALLFDVVTDSNGDGRLNDEVRAAIEGGCQDVNLEGVGAGIINAASSIAACKM